MKNEKHESCISMYRFYPGDVLVFFGKQLCRFGCWQSGTGRESFEINEEFMMNHAEKKPVILLVGFDQDIRQSIDQGLRETFETIECGNGQAGLDTSFELIPDLVLTDVTMPSMTGIEMCRELKTNMQTSRIPVIILTVERSMERQIEGFKVGADAYLTLPYNMMLLKVWIKNLLVTRKLLYRPLTKNGGSQNELKTEPVKEEVAMGRFP
jgi:DNA-binding response OmpR family regulator